jgi:urease accessory protein UreF
MGADKVTEKCNAIKPVLRRGLFLARWAFCATFGVKKFTFFRETLRLDPLSFASSIYCNDPDMIRNATAIPKETSAVPGELRGLLEQLGSTDENFAFTGVFPELKKVDSLPSLRTFLLNYQQQILIPLELTAIHTAYQHTVRNECRELVALDQKLANEPRLQNLAVASKRVGHIHLRRFRPMRERFVQRYLAAVDAGQANGWHTLVYGLSIAVYSLPLRQGLNFYAEQVLKGFAFTAALAHKLPKKSCDELWQELSPSCAAAVEHFFVEQTFRVAR